MRAWVPVRGGAVAYSKAEDFDRPLPLALSSGWRLLRRVRGRRRFGRRLLDFRRLDTSARALSDFGVDLPQGGCRPPPSLRRAGFPVPDRSTTRAPPLSRGLAEQLERE